MTDRAHFLNCPLSFSSTYSACRIVYGLGISRRSCVCACVCAPMCTSVYVRVCMLLYICLDSTPTPSHRLAHLTQPPPRLGTHTRACLQPPCPQPLNRDVRAGNGNSVYAPAARKRAPAMVRSLSLVEGSSTTEHALALGSSLTAVGLAVYLLGPFLPLSLAHLSASPSVPPLDSSHQSLPPRRAAVPALVLLQHGVLCRAGQRRGGGHAARNAARRHLQERSGEHRERAKRPRPGTTHPLFHPHTTMGCGSEALGSAFLRFTKFRLLSSEDGDDGDFGT